MKLVVKSEVGTIFVLDSKSMTWVRQPAHGPDSIFRVNEGKLAFWPDIVVGQRLRITAAETKLTITSAPIKMVFEVGPHDEEMYGFRIPKSKAETQAYIDNYNKTGAVGKDNEHRQTTMFKLPALLKNGAALWGGVFSHADKMKKSLAESDKPITVKPAKTYASPFPHCDSKVLHGPGRCAYCDAFPELQRERIAKGVNFTGERSANKPYKCPSEELRSVDKIHSWPGNRPYKVGATDHAKPPKPVTQADGFAGESDPLEFATLPGGGKLRYTDESRTTFKYAPKGWTDLGPQDEPRKATVCTRDECHSGPCNGFPRILKESTCFTQRFVRPVMIVDVTRDHATPTVVYVHKNNEVREFSISAKNNSMTTQAHIIQTMYSRTPDAVVFVNNHLMKDVLVSMGVDARMSSPQRFKAVL